MCSVKRHIVIADDPLLQVWHIPDPLCQSQIEGGVVDPAILKFPKLVEFGSEDGGGG